MTTGTQWWAAFVLAGLLLVACAPAAPVSTHPIDLTPTPIPPLQAATETQPPEATLLAFFTWYSGFPGNMLAQRTYRAHPVMQQYVSEAFFSEVDALLDSFDGQPGGGYDPFLCAQDRPNHYEVTTLAVSDDSATLRVSRGFGGGGMTNIQVAMQQTDGMWKIRHINCLRPAETSPPPTLPGTPATETAQGWARYHNSAYGFNTEIPTAWTPVETAVVDQNNADPVDAYVVFLKEGQHQPVALVISTGSLDTFRLVFPQPSHSREMTLNGYTVHEEQHFSGESYTIIEHPTPDTLRVAIRVIERSEAPGGDTGMVAARMLDTFRYDETPSQP